MKEWQVSTIPFLSYWFGECQQSTYWSHIGNVSLNEDTTRDPCSINITQFSQRPNPLPTETLQGSKIWTRGKNSPNFRVWRINSRQPLCGRRHINITRPMRMITTIIGYKTPFLLPLSLLPGPDTRGLTGHPSKSMLGPLPRLSVLFSYLGSRAIYPYSPSYTIPTIQLLSFIQNCKRK